MIKKGLILVIIALISFSLSNAEKACIPGVLQGMVTDEEKLPLNKVYLYTILGEEETLSNVKGEFSFKTNQPFPIKLVVQNQGYEDKIVLLTAFEDKIVIVLKRK